MALLCDQYYVLPLARRISPRLYRPPISELLVVWIFVHHQNGLHRECHSWPHLFLLGLATPLMVDQWGHVQVVSDPMSPKFLVYMVSVSIRILLDSFSNL